jgi:hypothetical protein
VITRILGHLGLPIEVSLPRPARSPPDQTWFDESTLVGDQADVFTPVSSAAAGRGGSRVS